MIDHVKDSVLLIINDALRKSLAFHGECTRSFLPNNVHRIPGSDSESNRAGIDAQVEGEVAKGRNPGGPEETHHSG